ncbi:unnamed protein product [Candida verbasci]|uniref:Magnesium transporter n=1 Tax=Candida verbasci TaxID=1227364 RepID=A0A9W4TSW1_9ASCO|nr:unnamed protein product [Candida verbasci]
MSSSSPSNIILGCSVAVISSAIQSLGITLQRKSHLLHNFYATSINSNILDDVGVVHLNHSQQKRKRNMWILGFSLFIIANILGSIIQITILPLIILSPLQSIGLIFNSIFSCLLIPGDVFTKKLWYGTIIISIGAFIIAYNVNVKPDDDDPINIPNVDERLQALVDKLFNKSFMIWFISTFIIMGILLLINKFYLNKKIKETSTSTTKDLDDSHWFSFNRFQFFKGINYGIISGTLTAHTFLFAKSIIDIVTESIMKSHSLKDFVQNPLPYILSLVMLSIVGLQLTAFNLGLKEITTAILYPLCFLIYNLINLINEIIFSSLLTNDKMSIVQLIWIIFGLCGVLFGVIILS